MVKPTHSEDSSPLAKWRRQKDKVLEVDPVEQPGESGEPGESGAEMPPHPKKTFKIPPTPEKIRKRSGDLTYIPIQPPPKRVEATMIPGQSRRRGADPTMMPGQEPPSKGEATMIPGQSRRRGADPTMMPGQSQGKAAEPKLMPGQSQGKTTEPKLMKIRTRRKGEATMVPIETGPATLDSAINAFIDELVSATSGLGMDFSIVQPEALKLDFFTDSKALRVAFSGRNQPIDRVVVREMAPTARGPGHPADAALPDDGPARKQMLEWESSGIDARQTNAKLNVATILDAATGALDWNEIDAPDEIEAIASAGQIIMEAYFFDADDGRNWLIELVNSTQATADETLHPTPELTPEGAKRLVMLLLNCLGSITERKSSL